MKPGALLFAAACVLTPAYGIYANAVGRQASMHHSETLDSGEMFIDSETALMRARFCQMVFHSDSGEIVSTLFGLEGMILEDGDPGPHFVCAPDGTTAKQRMGEFAERAAVSAKDLDRYHNILKVRGQVTDEQIAGFQQNDTDN